MLALRLTSFYGTLPDWLAALGTLGAFGVTYALLRREQRARREYEEDRRRAQARLVAAWTTAPRQEVDPDGKVKTVFDIMTRNGSDEPVRGVLVTMFTPTIHFIRPPAEPTVQRPVFEGGFDVLPPLHTQPTVIPLDGTSPGPLTVSFIDSQGYRWKRHTNGRLDRLEGPPKRRLSGG